MLEFDANMLTALDAGVSAIKAAVKSVGTVAATEGAYLRDYTAEELADRSKILVALQDAAARFLGAAAPDGLQVANGPTAYGDASVGFELTKDGQAAYQCAVEPDGRAVVGWDKDGDGTIELGEEDTFNLKEQDKTSLPETVENRLRGVYKLIGATGLTDASDASYNVRGAPTAFTQQLRGQTASDLQALSEQLLKKQTEVNAEGTYREQGQVTVKGDGSLWVGNEPAKAPLKAAGPTISSFFRTPGP